MKTQDHIDLLGKKCRDKVTGLTGLITIMSFDLYGGIHAIVHPGLTLGGKIKDAMLFDIAQLDMLSDDCVIPMPDFLKSGYIEEENKGLAQKPILKKIKLLKNT